MKKILYLIGIIILLFFMLDGVGSINKFGIEINNYKNIISKVDTYFAYNENTNKYSWFTPLKLPDSNLSLKIEHLTIANDTDIEMIKEITSHHFLMTMIAFENNSFKQIESIYIQNIVNDENLSLVASYLYKRAINKNYRWDIKKIEPLKAILKYKNIKAIGYIYPFPKNVSSNLFGTSKNLFKDAEQIVTIIYLNKTGSKRKIQYKFHLDYYLFMNIWDRILTIT